MLPVLADPFAIPFGAYAFPPLITAAGMLGLGAFVGIRERASPAAGAFLLLCLTIAFWQATFAAMYAAPDPAEALRWARTSYLAIPFIPPAIYGFTAYLLHIDAERRTLIHGGWALAALFSALALGTDELIVGVRHFFWGYYLRFGWLGVPYLAFFCGMLVLAMREYWTHYRKAEPGRFRERLRWLMIAFGIAYLAVLDYLPVYGVELYPFGYLPVFVFLVMVAWAMRHHRLVDLTPSFAADQILSTMADPLLVVDAAGRIRVANEAVSTVLGFDGPALIDAPVESLAPPGSPEGARLRGLLSLPTARDEEMRLLSREGHEVDVSVSASPLHAPDGSRVGTVLIARDVRERRRAEDALRHSEERFRSLIENISDAIVVLDGEGVVRFASSSLARVTGFTPEERLGREALELLHPDDRASVGESFAGAIRSPGVTVEQEFRLLHRDGSWRTVEATATNLLHHPAVAGVIVAYHDVSERRRAEEALRASEEQLLQSQKMEAVGRLAGGIAHDFNNLLTIINGHAELLAESFRRDPEALEMLAEVARAGRRAAALTGQLLAFSRKQVLKPKVIDLGAAVAGMESMLRRLIGEDVEFVARSAGARGRVEADPGQIEQVLLNLVVNARDAMPSGGRLVLETADVELSEEELPRYWNIPPGAYVQLSVSDTGCGMSKEIQERIFEPFFTTKEQGKGTGLGLSTVYGIVRQSGGHVSVESHPGRGTVFRALLPRVEGDPEPDPAPAPRRQLPAGEGTILLAEDDQSVRALARQILSRQGYRVLEAPNGHDALRLAEAHRGAIDLLLTDVVMPGLGGRELAESFRSLRPDGEVLYMSGYTDDALGRHGVLENGVVLLQKPFSAAALIEAVRVALEVCETRRAPLP